MNEKRLWFGAVLVTEPHVSIQERLKGQLKERRTSHVPTSTVNTSKGHPAHASASYHTPPHTTRHERARHLWHETRDRVVRFARRLSSRGANESFISFSSVTDVQLIRANFGISDRFAVCCGFLSLSVGCVVLGAAVAIWGVTDIGLGWGRPHEWTWEGLSRVLYGMFKFIFGALMICGMLRRSVLLLYLTTVFFQVFLVSMSISLITSWVTWTMAFTGVAQPHWRPGWRRGIDQIVQETLTTVLILFLSYGWFFGTLLSARAVVVAGGTGFERQTWFELMATKADVMQFLSYVHVSNVTSAGKSPHRFLSRFMKRRRRLLISKSDGRHRIRTRVTTSIFRHSRSASKSRLSVDSSIGSYVPEITRESSRAFRMSLSSGEEDATHQSVDPDGVEIEVSPSWASLAKLPETTDP
eukprot:Gregarina_sp_Poly_1__4542@NODE_2439_length_2135_cov_50_540135_g1549_i0_p1_GENE_NODE_2439_length_2135_cov_50_540135_g1549_i0NODE_2439_length_2135_cov_50_540135_g1549_i0_p1_ORF_typecomplete_len413_score34_62Maff2/PF12750_7/0_22_NODE_2439_length_2135_cov_50_540135_g1549_i08822120